VDGDIFRGDLRSGEGEVFIDVSGRQSLGMKVDEARHLLFVAGGFTGHAPVIYKVPIARDGTLGQSVPITVTGPAAGSAPGTFGLNGIDAPPNGDVLLVDHTELGVLATVDPVTGVSELVEITGGALVPGTPDGLLLDGRTAWVVQNFANSVAEVRLSPDLRTGEVVQTITDPMFMVPTTVAMHGNTLVLVNSRFDLGFPTHVAGTGTTSSGIPSRDSGMPSHRHNREMTVNTRAHDVPRSIAPAQHDSSMVTR